MEYPKFSDLLGKTLQAITGKVGEDEMLFTTVDNEVFKLHHVQDCCENVRIEDIEGNLQDLIGAPILQAEEVSNADGPAPEYPDSYTWTFYKIATVKGYVTIRWLGESNGYYSEDVEFSKVTVE